MKAIFRTFTGCPFRNLGKSGLMTAYRRAGVSRSFGPDHAMAALCFGRGCPFTPSSCPAEISSGKGAGLHPHIGHCGVIGALRRCFQDHLSLARAVVARLKGFATAISVWVAATSVVAEAQVVGSSDGEQVGFIRIVHAVAFGTGKLSVRLDGQDLYPKGYDIGQATGGIGLRAGAHELVLERAGIERGKLRLDVIAGETVTLIGFAEKIEPAEQDAPEPRWRIRLLRLKQGSPQSGYQVTMVSVCPEPEVVVEHQLAGEERWEVASVRRHRITTIGLGRSRAEAYLRDGRGVLTTISPDSPGNYVVVLFRDEQGNLRGLSFYDPKFVIAG